MKITKIKLKDMKNLKKYGCYTLLAVAVFTVMFFLTGFSFMEFNPKLWDASDRLAMVFIWAVLMGCFIGYKETE